METQHVMELGPSDDGTRHLPASRVVPRTPGRLKLSGDLVRSEPRLMGLGLKQVQAAGLALPSNWTNVPGNSHEALTFGPTLRLFPKSAKGRGIIVFMARWEALTVRL